MIIRTHIKMEDGLEFRIFRHMQVKRRKRILTFPKFNSKAEMFFSGLALFLLGRGLIVYSFFIPLKLFALNFYLGTALYLFGMVSSIGAMVIFSRAELFQPVTAGICRYSRHPMQVLSILMWIGTGMASGVWLLIGLALLKGVISYPSLLAQERFCLEKYRENYRSYALEVPRYLLFKSALKEQSGN